MMNRTVLIVSLLIAIAVSIFFLTIFNTLPDETAQPVSAEQTAAQTEQEKSFILANKELIHAAAYVQNIARRYGVCQKLHREIKENSSDINTKLLSWQRKMNAQFKGELPQEIAHKLNEKITNKIRLEYQTSNPSLEYCQTLQKRIQIDDIAPEVRHALARG